MTSLVEGRGEKKLAQQVTDPGQSPSSDPSIRNGTIVEGEDNEVFRASADGVDFRTVTWQRLIIILLKVQVATGVLGIPSAMGTLGAIPGSLIVVGWQVLNTCVPLVCREMRSCSCADTSPDTACILIDFRNRHSHCHSE